MDGNTNEIEDLGRSFSDATVIMHYAIADKAGLTGADHKYLGVLMQNGAMTAGELAKKTGLTTGAITGIIDRLEKRKLVSRDSDSTDRRKVLIVPDNDEIAKLFKTSSTMLRNKIRTMLGNFSNYEMQVIEKYMRLAIATMNEFTHQINQ